MTAKNLGQPNRPQRFDGTTHTHNAAARVGTAVERVTVLAGDLVALRAHLAYCVRWENGHPKPATLQWAHGSAAAIAQTGKELEQLMSEALGALVGEYESFAVGLPPTRNRWSRWFRRQCVLIALRLGDVT